MRIYADISKALNSAFSKASLIEDEVQRDKKFRIISQFALDLYHSLAEQYGLECADYEPPDLWYKVTLNKDTEQILNRLEQWMKKELR